jgi:cobalt-zinc-cadmium efflux system outer membrane protein
MRLLPLAAVVSLGLWLGSQARAEGQSGEHVIARREALLLGAKRGPGVALAQAPRTAVVTLGQRASALLRPPVVTLGGGYRAGSLTPGAELSVSLAQEVPLSGVGGARSELAKSFARSVETDAKRAQLEAAARAALAWIDALFARELLRLREEGRNQANIISKITASRVEAGVAAPHELALARGEAAAAHASVLDAEGMQVEALAELRFAVGVAPSEGVIPDGDLYQSDERSVDDDSAVRAALTQSPTIMLAVARAEQAQGETQLTSAVLGPSLSLGASYVREGTGDKVFLGFIGFPIPLIDAAGFETSRQRAAQKTAEAQVELTRAEIARDIRLALHDRHHWREVRDALQNGALAAYGEAFSSARTQYEVGTAEIGTVILARQRLLGAQERLAEVAARVQRADIALARATGSLLDEVVQ